MHIVNLYIFNEISRISMYGIGTYLKELTSSLQNKNINIHIIHLVFSKSEIIIEHAEKTETFSIPDSKNYLRRDNLEFVNHFYINTTRFLKTYIINTQNLIFQLNFNQSTVLIQSLKSEFECKVFGVLHYTEWGIGLLGNLSRLRLIMNKPEESKDELEHFVSVSIDIEREYFMTLDHLVCSTKYMKSILVKDYKISASHISIIPLGIKDEYDRTTINKLDLRVKWMISPDEKIILFAGRLNEAKGTLYLINAFRKVLEKIPSCKLLMIGDGNYDAHIKEAKKICTKIIFTGFLDKSDLYELYNIADIGIVPSLYETFGYVAVEMMMHNLPLIVAKTGGLREIVQNNESGLYISLKESPECVKMNINTLAQKILFFLQNPQKAAIVGDNGRNRYLQKYTSANMSRKMIDFINKIQQDKN